MMNRIREIGLLSLVMMLTACNANNSTTQPDRNSVAQPISEQKEAEQIEQKLARKETPKETLKSTQKIEPPEAQPNALKATKEATIRKVALSEQSKNTSQAQIHYLMGQFSPSKNKHFAKVPKRYANQSGFYLRKEALDAFINMHRAAKKDGVHLIIRSATRNFTAQKRIWERKWLGKRRLSDGTNVARDIRNPIRKSLKILEYSSMPGTSRHHWGTEVDLNSFNNKWFESGKGLKLFNWLNANAGRFGFCRPYTANRPYGYNEEKWHWSYKPLSAPMTKAASHVLADSQITGFLGSNTASKIGVVDKYILGIGAECR